MTPPSCGALPKRAVCVAALVFSGCAPAYTVPAVPSVRPPVSLSTMLRRHGYAPVPLAHLVNGLYAVRATIDSTPVALLLDCGFTGNITIVKSLADSLGIRGTPDRPMVGVGGTVATDTTHLNHFALGAVRFGPQFVKINASLPVPDGLLGAQFYGATGAVMDYDGPALYVDSSPPHPLPELPDLARSRGAVAVPLRRFTRGDPSKVIYTVRATIGRTLLTLILDTGADAELVLDRRRADALGLRMTSTKTVSGIGGPREVRAGRVGRLALGRARLDGTSFVALDMSDIEQRLQSDNFPRVDGVVGAAVLATHHAVVDFGHDVVYLHL